MKFFFGILAFIAATVVVVLLVVSLFKSFGDTNTGSVVTSSYGLEQQSAIDTVARYRAQGPVVADENHRELRITISKTTRTLEIIKGYNGTVEKTATLQNTPEAYRAFLGALEAARFADTRETVIGDPDTTCVTGNKYYYELSQNGTKPVDTWTTSCSLTHGSFAGNGPATADIFRKQIPNYSELTASLNLLVQ